MPETQIHGKRRAPRHYLGGVVELTDLDSGRLLAGYGARVQLIERAGERATQIEGRSS